MGAIAEAFVAFAQPLIDQTDGSMEEVNRAFSIAQLCYNLALLPEDSREETLGKMRDSLAMDAAEFKAFRRVVVDPMIERHEEMFPRMHERFFRRPLLDEPSLDVPWLDEPSLDDLPSPAPSIATAPAKQKAVIDRYAPCPCNSGKKYKFCCGAKRR